MPLVLPRGDNSVSTYTLTHDKIVYAFTSYGLINVTLQFLILAYRRSAVQRFKSLVKRVEIIISLRLLANAHASSTSMLSTDVDTRIERLVNNMISINTRVDSMVPVLRYVGFFTSPVMEVRCAISEADKIKVLLLINITKSIYQQKDLSDSNLESQEQVPCGLPEIEKSAQAAQELHNQE